MSTVLAIIDNSAAAQPVVATAKVIARALADEVVAVTVQTNGVAAARAVAEAAGVELRIAKGAAVEQICEALADPDVSAGVIGLRGRPAGKRPAGSVAAGVIQVTPKPIVLVPPDACVSLDGALQSVLVPLDGTGSTARALASALTLFAEGGAEVIGVHVFDDAGVPRFMDRPEHDMQDWMAEFVERYCSGHVDRLEVRTGDAGDRVIDLATAEEVGLIAIGWSQDLSPGHAATVREILSRSCKPVLLLPVKRAVVRA